MIEESAIVVAVDGENAWIESSASSSCGSCSAVSSCGTSTLSKVMGNRSNRVKVINRVGAKVGERVVIAISEGGLLRGAARLYLIPLLALFVTVLSAEWILDSWFSTSSELLTIGLGAVGAFASVRWMKSRGLFESEELIPTIVKLYNDPIISPIV